MDAQTLALLLTSSELAPEVERQPLDRVRLQKAVFLVVQRGPDNWRTLYRYEPYDWGPYSRELARTMSSLEQQGLVQAEPVPGHRYGRYSATDRGELEARRVIAALSPIELDFLRRVRSYVTSKSFANLLREVYAAYPEFATESKFRG